jgi:hypothetical protein
MSQTQSGDTTRILFLLLAAAACSLLSCYPYDTDGMPAEHNCTQDLAYSPSKTQWEFWGLSLEHDEPRLCPVPTDGPDWPVITTAGNVWETYEQFFSAELWVYNSDGEDEAYDLADFIYDDASGHWFAQLSTFYIAATGSVFRDRMRYDMIADPYPWAQLDITYQSCPNCM